MAEIRLSSILSHMKQRCYNKNSPDYKNYGARGIEVCKEWRENSKLFVKWAKENGLSAEMVEAIMNAIHEESCKLQM